MDARRLIHNKLITDFTALKHSNGTDNCFANVGAIFTVLPSSFPNCQIVPTQVSAEPQGMSFDFRSYGFSAITYDTLSDANGDAAAKTKIDRLSDIEDRVLDYIEQIPHPIENNISGVHIVRFLVSPSRYSYEDTEKGMGVYQIIDFQLDVNITVRDL